MGFKRTLLKFLKITFIYCALSTFLNYIHHYDPICFIMVVITTGFIMLISFLELL